MRYSSKRDEVTIAPGADAVSIPDGDALFLEGLLHPALRIPQNEPRIGLWSGGTRAGGSTFANDLDIHIPFYSNTSLVKRAWAEINYYDDNQSGDLVLGRGYVYHSGAANTNAVSAIRLSAGTHQFISGTVAELYGSF